MKKEPINLKVRRVNGGLRGDMGKRENDVTIISKLK